MVQKVLSVVDFEVNIIKDFTGKSDKGETCKIAICQIQNKLNLHDNLHQLQKICSDLKGSDTKAIILPPKIFSLPNFKERYNLINLLGRIKKIVQDVPIIINPFGKDIFLVSDSNIIKLCKHASFKHKIQYMPLDDVIGCEIDLCIQSIPFYLDDFKNKYSHFASHCFTSCKPMIYLNKVGVEEELVFDGHSCVIGATGEILYQMPGWVDCVSTILLNNREGDISVLDGKDKFNISNKTIDERDIYSALVSGVRDYFGSNNLKRAVIGLSGGIDSSLVSAIAVDALGEDNVIGIYLPSEFSSDLSKSCVDDLVSKLGIKLEGYPISDLVDCMHKTFLDKDSCNKNTKHNIQARIRSIILMSYANQHNCVVLSTSNKVEIILGYVTLYGDTAGGYAPLKDIYKSQVYNLANWRNDNLLSFSKSEKLDIFSDKLINRAPTSELEENCLDSDDLPDYSTLEVILGYLLHGSALPDKLANSPLFQQIANIILKNRFKRFQMPLGSALYSKESKHYPICN